MKNEKVSPHSNSIPKVERIVETKICKHCETKFEITDKDLEFYEKVSPIFSPHPNPLPKGEGIKHLGDGKVKYLIPTPKLCPDCRQQRRLSFRNERKLYKRKCDFTGKDIISMYSPDKKYKVYDQEIWWSDKWDALDYGKDFDFNKSFFEQFEDLGTIFPRPTLTNTYANNINANYVNYIVNAKDCYFCFGGGNLENVHYGDFNFNCSNCLDILMCSDCEYCSNSINCKNCYNVHNCKDSTGCNNSYLLENCENCNYCYGCINISNKQYYIYNEQKTKYDYDNLILNENRLYHIFDKQIRKSLFIINSDNCLGDNITNSSNCHYCYDIKDCQDSKYTCNVLANASDIYDGNYCGVNAIKVYEVMNTSISTSNILFSNIIRDNSQNILYSSDIFGSSNLFGCIGLRNKQYCILNKQYTKEEYEILVPKIIEHMVSTGEWGEFFPSNISPFGYNETVANEYFPLDRRDVLSKHLYKWSDYEAPFPKVEKIITVEMYNNTSMLDNANKVPDDILNWAIECEITKKPFRIIKQELEFYRKHNLPIPKRHPDQRHLDRMVLRNPRKLFDRKCDKCGIDMKTTYAPERKEIVYCEDCYNKEVY